MNAQEIFRRAADLFLKARDVPPSGLDSFLDRECAGNDTLRTEVRRLLAARDEGGPFETLAARLIPVHAGLRDDLPETCAGSSGAPAERFELTDQEDVPDASVGNYRLLERIGEGGFGRVWVAEQREPVQRRVALKVIKAGMDSREVLARFERERQALAVMDHPNVARVFDAGVTVRGRPYFVMEHVPGPSITEFCDANRLRLRRRLDLFVPVCEAVHHAHQKGIIHRDLKPSNVLVTLLDGRPLPKVIDFGIAKATTARLTERTLYTEMGRLMGTPEYMSPEQASGSGIDIDTRSDVYSLGVILYELLTGTLPFDTKTLRERGYHGIVKIICEMEPPRPSTRFSTLMSEPVTRRDGATPVEIARTHGTDTRSLQRELRGELDWIVMKCLEKDRARRYESAAELAADVRRYLAGEAIVAAPPSPTYRLAKFVQRNRIAIAAAAAVLASLLIGLGVSLYLFFQERDARARAVAAESEQSVLRQRADDARAAEARERHSAESERDIARTEKAKAQQISTFLQDMLAAIQPMRARGNRDVTVAEALDEASERVARGELSSEPEVEAAVRMTIGATYRNVGKYPPSQEHLQTALDMLRRIHRDEHAGIATAQLELGTTLYEMGAYADAEALFRQALELNRRLLPEESVEVATAQHMLGKAYSAGGKFNDAQTLYESALQTYRAVHGPEHVKITEVLADLGGLFYLRSDHAAAEPLWRTVLEQRLKLFGEDDYIVAIGYNNLATARSTRGDYPGAIEYHRKALAIRRKLLGPEHAEVGHSLRNLATCLNVIGYPAEAETLYREALVIQRASLGPDHPHLATSLESFGNLLRLNGKLDESAPLHEEALAIRRRTFGDEHSMVAQAQHFLGIVLLEQKEYDAAEKALLEAREMRRRTVGRDDIMVAENSIFLGRVHRGRGEVDAAEARMREGIALIRKLTSEDHPRVAQAVSALATVLRDKADLDGAVAAYTEAWEIYHRRGMGEHRDAATALHNLGVLHRQRGAASEAEPVLQQALTIRQKLLPEGDPAIAATLSELDALRAEAANATSSPSVPR